MDKSIQIYKHCEISKTVLNEINLANSGKQIKDCTDEEIKQTLRFVFAIIGLKQNLIPQGEHKEILMYFIKKRLWSIKIDEIRLSFEYAIEKRIEVELALFGDTFSAKVLMDVLDSYQKYKIKIKNIEPKNESDAMNIYERANKIVDFLTPETKEVLNKIGEIKKVEPVIRVKTEAEIIIQDIFKEFDDLHRKKDDGHLDSMRIVFYEGRDYTQEDFLTLRLTELNKL